MEYSDVRHLYYSVTWVYNLMLEKSWLFLFLKEVVINVSHLCYWWEILLPPPLPYRRHSKEVNIRGRKGTMKTLTWHVISQICHSMLHSTCMLYHYIFQLLMWFGFIHKLAIEDCWFYTIESKFLHWK